MATPRPAELARHPHHLYPVASDKAGEPGYFGFAEPRSPASSSAPVSPCSSSSARTRPTSRPSSARSSSPSSCRRIYLQPDPPQVNNPVTIVAATVEGNELQQSTLMQRLAAQLDVDFKGSRSSASPASASSSVAAIASATRSRPTTRRSPSPPGRSVNHWLCVLSFEIDRDWTWDGLDQTGIDVRRKKQFTGEARHPGDEIVGYVQLAQDGEPRRDDQPRSQLHPGRLHRRGRAEESLSMRRRPSRIPSPTPSTSIHADAELHSRVDPASSDNETATRELQLPGDRHSGAGAEDRRRRVCAVALSARPRLLGDRGPPAVPVAGIPSRSRIRTTPTSRASSATLPIRCWLPQSRPAPGSSGRSAAGHRSRADPGDHHGQGNDNAGIDAMQLMTAETPIRRRRW